MTQDTHSADLTEPHEETAAPAEAVADEAAQEPSATGPKAPRVPPGRPAAAQAAIGPKLPPSWILSASGEQLTRDQILARYRRQRGLPEHPFENGAKPVPPPGYRDRIMNEPRSAVFMERQPQAVQAPPPPGPRTFTVAQTLAIAAAVALVAGGGAGVMGARYAHHTPSSQTPASAADGAEATASPSQQLHQAQNGATQASHDTVIDKKPVSTATLQVEDVTGETNSYIPLALHAVPGGLDKDMLLKISGVPKDAYLTSGHRQDDQVWALSLAEVKNLRLVVPQAREPEIDLAIAAFEPSTGQLAAPVKTMTVALKDVVVQPTSAPPPDATASAAAPSKSALPGADAQSVPETLPQNASVALAVPETAATRQLIGKADQLFKAGNVKAALRAYERAWGNDGSAAAAFGIAQSYDPLVLATLDANNGTADKARAIEWYQRAAAGGNPDAAPAIVRLQMKP